MSDRQVPAEIGRYATTWFWSSQGWLHAFHALGVAGVLLPALIASHLLRTNTETIVALCATVASGLQTFLRCDTRADRYHVAYRGLKTAQMRFELEGDHYPISRVIDAFDQGERIIETAFAPRGLADTGLSHVLRRTVKRTSAKQRLKSE